jgi:hypothetical protein
MVWEGAPIILCFFADEMVRSRVSSNRFFLANVRADKFGWD